MGKVRLPADDPEGNEYVAAWAEHAKSRWIAALQGSAQPRARAVGLLLTDWKQGEAMARLALQSDDPALYSLALNACETDEHPSAACAQISPRVVAQLDPDNALAWLGLAQQLRRAGDPAGEREAMGRAAAAHRFEDYSFSLLSYSDASVPSDLSTLERYAFATEVIGLGTVTGVSNWETSKYCSKDAVSDELVREQCRALAELLDAKGSTLSQLLAAKSIGARTGWSPERVESSARYIDALEAGLPRIEPDSAASRWSCGALRASNAYFNQWARADEVSALRDRLEQSGESVRERALQHRQFVEDLMGRAASAYGGGQELQSVPP